MTNEQVNFIDYDKIIEDMPNNLTQIEKARYIYIIIMFALAVFVFGCAKICEMKGISFRILEQLPDVFLSFFAAAVAALSMLMSYFVTLRIVRNKEW